MANKLRTGPGRNIKRRFKRDTFIKVRASKPYRDLLTKMKLAYQKDMSRIISDADIVEWALHNYAISIDMMEEWMRHYPNQE